MRVSWVPPREATVYGYRLRVSSQAAVCVHLGADVTKMDLDTNLPAAVVTDAKFLARYRDQIRVDAITPNGDVPAPVSVTIIRPQDAIDLSLVPGASPRPPVSGQDEGGASA